MKKNFSSSHTLETADLESFFCDTYAIKTIEYTVWTMLSFFSINNIFLVRLFKFRSFLYVKAIIPCHIEVYFQKKTSCDTIIYCFSIDYSILFYLNNIVNFFRIVGVDHNVYIFNLIRDSLKNTIIIEFIFVIILLLMFVVRYIPLIMFHFSRTV